MAITRIASAIAVAFLAAAPAMANDQVPPPGASYTGKMRVKITDGGWSKSVDTVVTHFRGLERHDFEIEGADQTFIYRADQQRYLAASEDLPGVGLSVKAAIAPLYVGIVDIARMNPKRGRAARVSGESCRMYQINGMNTGGGSFRGDVCLTSDGVLMLARGEARYADARADVDAILTRLDRQEIPAGSFDLPADLPVMEIDDALQATLKLLVPALAGKDPN